MQSEGGFKPRLHEIHVKKIDVKYPNLAACVTVLSKELKGNPPNLDHWSYMFVYDELKIKPYYCDCCSHTKRTEYFCP